MCLFFSGFSGCEILVLASFFSQHKLKNITGAYATTYQVAQIGWRFTLIVRNW